MMLKDLNVIKYFLVFSIFLIFTNCSVLKDEHYETETYEIIREKTRYFPKITQLKIIAYQYNNRNELIPAAVSINGITLYPKILNDSILNNFIQIKPDLYNLRISLIQKETITIKKLLIKDGDSIVVKAYMKEDLTPLY